MRVLSELLKKAIKALFDDMEFVNGAFSGHGGGTEARCADAFAQFSGFVLAGANDDSSLVITDGISASGFKPRDAPSVSEISADEPPEFRRVVIFFDLRQDSTGEVIGGEIARREPGWSAISVDISPSLVVPAESAPEGVIGMLGSAGGGQCSSASQGNQRSVIPSHDCGDGSPMSGVGEYEIAHQDVFDGSISGGGENHGSRDKTRPARTHIIHQAVEWSSIEVQHVPEDFGLGEAEGEAFRGFLVVFDGCDAFVFREGNFDS